MIPIYTVGGPAIEKGRLLACLIALMFGPVADPLPFFTRLWFSFVCALRVVVDGAFAGRVWAVRDRKPALPETSPGSAVEPEADDVEPEVDDVEPDADDEADLDAAGPPDVTPSREEAALLLLAVLQREGRLVDFLEQDIENFDDADVGAAARVLHAGCRKALHRLGDVTPIRDEEEETRITVEEGIDTGEVKLVGAVTGDAPYRGILRHKGWRVALQLPAPTAEHDVSVVAPAEVEL